VNISFICICRRLASIRTGRKDRRRRCDPLFDHLP